MVAFMQNYKQAKQKFKQSSGFLWWRKLWLGLTGKECGGTCWSNDKALQLLNAYVPPEFIG